MALTRLLNARERGIAQGEVFQDTAKPRCHRAPPRRPSRHRASCPSLRTKHATMHTLRHTCAMRLRHAGIDVAVIALWLGHEQMATANIYRHADMDEKERAIARVTPPGTAPGRYQPPDPLLAFLDSL